jgi:WD domain, G-beta repeat
MAERDRCRTRQRRHAVTTGLLALSVAALTTVGTAPAAAARAEAVLSSSSGVTAVAFSRDGTLLASGYADGAVRLWDVAAGQIQGPVLLAGSGAAGAVNGVAFSPDGTLLAGGYADGMVRVWNPVTGQPSGSPLQAGSAVNAVAFSQNGKLADGGANGVIVLWSQVGQPAGRGSGYWIILGAAVIALALAVLAAVITTRETRPAKR